MTAFTRRPILPSPSLQRITCGRNMARDELEDKNGGGKMTRMNDEIEGKKEEGKKKRIRKSQGIKMRKNKKTTMRGD